MTRTEEIAGARALLAQQRAFRAMIADHIEGSEKPAQLAEWDALIAKTELTLLRLESSAAPLAASAPLSATMQ